VAWEALTGVVEWWADEGIRDLGRGRFHASRGHKTGGPPLPEGSIWTKRSAFVARRRPWRLAWVALGPVDEGDAAVLAWADEATAVLVGEPASQHVVGPNETWGDLGLRRMLEPGPLEVFVPKPWSENLRIEGRLLEDDMTVVPEFVSLATDHYEATYDPQLEILTSWSAFMDGKVAWRQALSNVVSVG